MISIQTIFILVQFSPILPKRKKHAKRKITQKKQKKRENIIGTSEKTKHKINREKRQKNQKSNSSSKPVYKGIEGGSGG